jgi:hypothetical protein
MLAWFLWLLMSNGTSISESELNVVILNFRSNKGVDAIQWGEDYSDPFVNLTESGKTKLKAKGIDIAQLSMQQGRLLTGEFFGSRTKDFINRNSKITVVLDDSFGTHGDIYSLGPVLIFPKARPMGRIVSSNLIWILGEARARGDLVGVRVILESKDGDHGWQPPRFVGVGSDVNPEKKHNRSAAEELLVSKRQLLKSIESVRGIDLQGMGKKVSNPFAALREEGKIKLRQRGVDVDRLLSLPARLIEGELFVDGDTNLVCGDPGEITIFAKGFISNASLFCKGPILGAEGARFMGKVVGGDLVWIVETAFPRDALGGAPVILAPQANISQLKLECEKVWFGDYGWRRPKDFLAEVRPVLDRKR